MVVMVSELAITDMVSELAITDELAIAPVK